MQRSVFDVLAVPLLWIAVDEGNWSQGVTGPISKISGVPRPTYNFEYFIEQEFDESGNVSKRVVVRMQIERGVRVRFCVGYQIKDAHTGKLKDIVRYDDFGGYFHRHSAGFPPGRDHISINLPPGMTQSEYILSDLDKNANIYETQAVLYGYEVEEEENP